MNKTRFLLCIFVYFSIAYGNAGITFDVEDLQKPTRLLPLSSYDDILNELIKEENLSYGNRVQSAEVPYGIVARSETANSLVSFGFHPFLHGMYQAYADHRPFTLSPDMIWLLICQGFANHVNNNAEKLRSKFVRFAGKKTLIVRDDSIDLNNPKSPWEKVFPSFTKQLGYNVGKALVDALVCDFSTTTPVEKVASEVTIMETFKSYFEYVLLAAGCGIPKITLIGSTQDWQRVYDKANLLRKYDLDWWIDELNPILLEFVKASRGEVDKDFWRNMFKYHTLQSYGAPKVIDGWIVKMFPYNKAGKRNNLKELSDKIDDLPKEMVYADLRYFRIDPDGSVSETPLELWAGFVGLRQDKSDFTLVPQIGWMVRKKSKVNASEFLQNRENLMIRVSTFPKELLEFPALKSLSIDFIDSINIPDDIKNMKIEFLTLRGKLAPEKADRIISLLPNTVLRINADTFRIFRDTKNPKLPDIEDTRKAR